MLARVTGRPGGTSQEGRKRKPESTRYLRCVPCRHVTKEAKAEAEQDWQGWQQRGATRKVQRGEMGTTLWPAVTLGQLLPLSNKSALQIMYDMLCTCMPLCIKCLYLTCMVLIIPSSSIKNTVCSIIIC